MVIKSGKGKIEEIKESVKEGVSCFGFRYYISDRVIIRQKFILV